MRIFCSFEEYEEHDESCDGVCLSCGEWTFGGVEPDAHGYECEGCGAMKVCGAGEALLMGNLELTEED